MDNDPNDNFPPAVVTCSREGFAAVLAKCENPEPPSQALVDLFAKTRRANP